MRRIAHVDMDAFFAAIEEQHHTELCGLPLVIGGHGDTTESGVVSTACYAAREYGIRSTMPLRTAYPSIFGLFYPDCGDFIGFIANFHSRRLIQHAAYCFRDYADFPLEHVATLGFVLGVSWSEYRSFWHYGNRAFMVTDTALCRYPYYHSADDTPDKLTYVDLGRITDGLIGCFTEIARSGIVDRAV